MESFKIRPSITNREPIRQYLKDISRISLLSAEEEKKLAIEAKSGSQKAIDKLVTANLRFVISVAKQYQNRGVDLEDLINEGNSGLIHAAHLYDPSKDVRFLSYAVWWIRQSIIKAIYNGGRTIRIPINQIRDITTLLNTIRTFEQENQRTPTPEELEDLTGFSDLKTVQLLNYYNNNPISVDSKFSDDEDSGTLLDITPNKNSEPSDKKLMDESYKEQIDSILNLLPDRDSDILRLHFGIGVSKTSTADIASIFGITTERIRQLKDRAIKRLQTLYLDDVKEILYG